jgi:hypothetical protein
VAATAPNLTPVAPVKLEPVMVTLVPMPAVPGLRAIFLALFVGRASHAGLGNARVAPAWPRRSADHRLVLSGQSHLRSARPLSRCAAAIQAGDQMRSWPNCTPIPSELTIASSLSHGATAAEREAIKPCYWRLGCTGSGKYAVTATQNTGG